MASKKQSTENPASSQEPKKKPVKQTSKPAEDQKPIRKRVRAKTGRPASDFPNLTPFPKGVSGNPAGKPRGTISYKHRIQEKLLDLLEDQRVNPRDPRGKREAYLDIMLKNFMDDALQGNRSAQSFIIDRLISTEVIDDIDAYINRGKREDRYFMSYQLYKDAFDQQQQVLMSKMPAIFCMCGRRAGKTEMIQRKIADQLVIKENCQVVYIAKTMKIGVDQVWSGVHQRLSELGVNIVEDQRNEAHIKLDTGSEFWIWGNNSKEEREKLRGFNWSLAIVDEAQSQKELEYLMTSILEPPLEQNKGQIVICGTGPRIRGTEWERIWIDAVHYPALRLNWNISENPFVEDAKQILQGVLKKHGWTESTPRFIQEWLGKVCYDDDALVYRLAAENLFDDNAFRLWAIGRDAKGQPVMVDGKAVISGDVHFLGGVDVGFNDADSVVVLAYADYRPEIFLVYEKKVRRTGIKGLEDNIHEAIQYIKTNPIFDGIPEHNRTSWMFYMDTGGGGKKISFDFTVSSNLPVQPAYKFDKALGIEQLQEEVNARNLKIRGSLQDNVVVGDSPFIDEAMRTVFARDESDNLTRTVDDDTYHPDELDAVLYAYRAASMFRKKRKE